MLAPGGSSRAVTCIDADRDGFCNDEDCDDANPDVYPGAPEICDGLNNDCNDPQWPSLDAWAGSVIRTTAEYSVSEVVVDVDGDGDVDALSYSFIAGTIAWHENTLRDGSVWVERMIATVDSVFSTSAADVDGDGDVDVLSVSYFNDAVYWHENTFGDGSAWTVHEIANRFDGPKVVVAADMDGDGDVDVLSAAENDERIAWHENTMGDGSEWIVHLIATAVVEGDNLLRAVDMDGDGDLDVLSTLDGQDNIAWHENVSGDASTWAAHLIATTVDVHIVVAADVDGDGDADVVAAFPFDDRIAWYDNVAGDGATWLVRDITTTTDGAAGISVVDMDRDGDQDVAATAYYEGTVSWWENTGGDGSVWVEQPVSATAIETWFVLAADVDGDGDEDLWASADGDYPVRWYEHGSIEKDDDGDGLAECDGDCDDAAPKCVADCTGDVDGDGTRSCADCDDADAASYPGAVEQCDGNDNACAGWTPTGEVDADGDGYVGCSEWYDLQGDQPAIVGGRDCDDSNAAVHPGADTVCDGLNNDCDDLYWPSLDYWDGLAISTTVDSPGVVAADVNGDGRVDVVSASVSGDAVAWYENVTGGVSPWGEHLISTTVDGPLVAVAADLDGDNDVDIVSASYYDTKISWHENATGDGSEWIEHVLATSIVSRSIVAVDLDRDDDVDLLWINGTGDRITWHENVAGDGSVWLEHVISAVTDGPKEIVAADVDGDGDTDVLSSSSGLRVNFHENLSGDGLAWEVHTVSTTPGAEAIFAADVDGDLDVDVLAVDYVWVMWHENVAGDGSTWFRHLISRTADRAESVFGVDMDGDGDLDVVSASKDDNTVAWHENMVGDGLVWIERLVSSTTLVAPTSVVVADVSDDGEWDIVASSATDNKIVWYDMGSREEDDDGDGFVECGLAGGLLDCDDADGRTYPRAPEVYDGRDNQCYGDYGYGVVDEVSGVSGFHDRSDKTKFSWEPQEGAVAYAVARSTWPFFCGSCACEVLDPVPVFETHVLDEEVPGAGEVFHYLVRTREPVPPGSWGPDSTGAERTGSCP